MILLIGPVLAYGQSAISSSGDPLIDNLRAVEVQIQELTAEGRLAERWSIERKVEMRYGRQIAKALEQSSSTLLNRIQTINSEFSKFGRTLESTEPLREAAARYRTYSRLMKFSGEPNNSFIQIEEFAGKTPTTPVDRIRLTKNGKSVAEINPETMEFMRKSEILSLNQIKPSSGNNYVREYDIVHPKSRVTEVTAPRIEIKAYEPDKDLAEAAR